MSNYSGIVYRINNIRPHSNADRLNCSNILTNNVIIGRDVKEGDLGVFFPVECQLSPEFCAANDLIRRKDENGKPAGGMLQENRRIKCISLRGEKSMGFWCPIVYLERWAAACGFELPFLKENQEVDNLMGYELCRKYEIQTGNSHFPNREKNKQAKNKINIVDGQFAFHFDTSPLWKNGSKLNPNDIISVSVKMHGSLFQCCNLLIERKLTLFERIAKWFGAKIQQTEYKEIVASRTVIKTGGDGPGWYGEDVWTDTFNKKLKGRLKQGETVYGEIVNQTSSGKWIQKLFDYGFEEKETGLFIFRITMTAPDGTVTELSWPQLKARCLELGYPHCQELFYGKLSDLFPGVNYDDPRWNGDFVEKFYEKFAPDIYDPMCKNKVPQEGAILRVEGKEIANYKAKSALFLRGESESLDSGELSIEQQEESSQTGVSNDILESIGGK